MKKCAARRHKSAYGAKDCSSRRSGAQNYLRKDDRFDCSRLYPALQNEQVVTDLAGIPSSIESLWMAEFIRHDKRVLDGQAKCNLRALLELPGSSEVAPAVANAMRETDPTPQRTRITEKANPRRMGKDQRRNEERRKNRSVKQWVPLSPYRCANSKIRSLLCQRGLRPHRESVRSVTLDRLLDVNRNEAKVTVVLQSAWRRVLAARIACQLAVRKRSAIRLQALARGRAGRATAARRRRVLNRAAMRAQRRYRLRVALRRWRRTKRADQAAANRIVASWRGHVGRMRACGVRRDRAAFRFRLLARASAALELWRQLWRIAMATRLQGWWRAVLAVRAVECVRRSKAAAVVIIGRWWRGYVARVEREEREHYRALEGRARQVRMLATEGKFWSNHAEELRRRLDDGSSLRLSKGRDLALRAKELRETIAFEEKWLSDQNTIKPELSPRSVWRGWLEQVDLGIAESRRALTASKLELVFDVGRAEREAKADLVARIEAADGAERRRDACLRRREQELEGMRACQRARDQEREGGRRRRAAAGERRRWAVPFALPNGKPERAERPRDCAHVRGMGPETTSFCGGTVDLLAAASGGRSPPLGSANCRSEFMVLTNIAERARLRSHQNEVLNLCRVVDPILGKIRKG